MSSRSQKRRARRARARQRAKPAGEAPVDAPVPDVQSDEKVQEGPPKVSPQNDPYPDEKSEEKVREEPVRPKPHNQRDKLKKDYKKWTELCPSIGQVKFGADLDHPLSFSPPTTYFLPKSLYHTKETVEILNKYHPCKFENVHSFSAYNRHPLCASFRAMAEAFVISALKAELKHMGHNFGHIVDVGGAVVRHHGNRKRKFIHSCVPMFETKDLLRRFNLPGENFCRHMWEECDCVRAVASMSVHSLYYVEPRDILKRLLSQVVPIHYAVLHRYPESSGSLMHGEMEYAKSNEQVRVFAKGNLTPYIHSSMEWLSGCSYTCDKGTLAWELVRSYEDVHVYKFIAHPDAIREREFKEELKSEFDDAPYKAVINECMRYHAEIDSKERKSFLSRVSRKGVARNLDTEKLTFMADSVYMNQPKVLSNPSRGTRYTASQRKRALAFEKGRDFRIPLLILIVAAFLYSQKNLYDWIPFFGSLMVYFSRKMLISRGAELYDFLSLKFGPANFLMQVRLYDYCCEGFKLRDISLRKCFKYVFPEFQQCQPGFRAVPFVYHPDFVPMMPRRCDHNYDACIRHKVLAETQEDDIEDVELAPELADVAKLMDITPLTFDQWVSRFPAAKEKRLRKEMEEFENEVLEDREINQSSLHLKAEFYSEIKPPRPIHASNVLLNFRTGRWLVPIGEALAELLPYHICFPIHGDSLLIGNFFAEYSASVMAQSDFSQYDSTQRESCLNMLADFFTLCGMPPHVADLMRLDTKYIRITTRKGFSYSAKGFRLSGRSETLIANTVLTISIFLQAARPYIKGLLAKGDDAVLFLHDGVDEHIVNCIRERVDKMGFITKMELAHKDDIEFCSSYFIPCEQGYILTPKPGKMLAKTFWCKNTNYNEEQMKMQFAGILRGLEKNLSWLPFFGEIYDNPCYKEYFERSEAIRQQYNEYTDELVTANFQTALWFSRKYDLTFSQLDELGTELATSFPVRLQSYAAEAMIDCDWGRANFSDLLTDNLVEDVSQEDELSVFFEEAICMAFPLMYLFFGFVETLLTGSVYHLFVHTLLHGLRVKNPISALLFHLLHNLIVGFRGPNNNNNYEQKISKEIKNAKAQKAPPKAPKEH